MKTETMEELLGGHPFFAGLGAGAVRLIAGCASNVHFAAGDYIFGEGEACDRCDVPAPAVRTGPAA